MRLRVLNVGEEGKEKDDVCTFMRGRAGKPDQQVCFLNPPIESIELMQKAGKQAVEGKDKASQHTHISGVMS